MIENYVISKLKDKFIFWKIIIIRFLNVETDPRLWYSEYWHPDSWFYLFVELEERQLFVFQDRKQPSTDLNPQLHCSQSNILERLSGISGLYLEVWFNPVSLHNVTY
jgi:hypothetical protein